MDLSHSEFKAHSLPVFFLLPFMALPWTIFSRLNIKILSSIFIFGGASEKKFFFFSLHCFGMIPTREPELYPSNIPVYTGSQGRY